MKTLGKLLAFIFFGLGAYTIGFVYAGSQILAMGIFFVCGGVMILMESFEK